MSVSSTIQSVVVTTTLDSTGITTSVEEPIVEVTVAGGETIVTELAGPPGPAGSKGDKGDTGDTGPQGLKGDTGQIGPQGLEGKTGPQGERGFLGYTGSKGDQGDVGPAGPSGAQGIQGDQGPKGDKGDTGPQGPIGLTGATGLQGDIGPMGPQGPAADDTAITNLNNRVDALNTAVTNINNLAPETLDSFKEVASAINNDPQFAATMTTALGVRVRVDAAQSFDAIQRAVGRSNIDATSPSDVSNSISSALAPVTPRLVPTGGAKGQVLAKSSATDNNVAWVDAPTGGGTLSSDSNPTLSASLNLAGYDVKSSIAAGGTQYVKAIPSSSSSSTHNLVLAARDATDSMSLASITLTGSSSGAYGTIGLNVRNNGGSSGGITVYSISSGGSISGLYTLPVTAGLAGQVLTKTGVSTTPAVWVTPSASVGFYAGGLLNASEVIGRVHAAQTFTIATVNCKVTSDTASTASAVITIKKNGTQIGTATFGAGGTSATIVFSTTAVTKNDLITFHAPDTPDATLANVSGTISN